jgi:CpXC protein
MSLPSETKISCEKCGHVFKATIWQSVDTGDKQLSEAFLRGDVNVLTCPQCGVSGFSQTPVLYHDLERQLMVWVYDSSLTSNPEERTDPKFAQVNRALGGETIYADGFAEARYALSRLDDSDAFDRLKREHPDLSAGEMYAEVFRFHFEQAKQGSPPRPIEKEIEYLRNEIRRQRDLYYLQNAPEISNDEFDNLVKRLKELEREHPELNMPDSPRQRDRSQDSVEDLIKLLEELPPEGVDFSTGNAGPDHESSQGSVKDEEVDPSLEQPLPEKPLSRPGRTAPSEADTLNPETGINKVVIPNKARRRTFAIVAVTGIVLAGIAAGVYSYYEHEWLITGEVLREDSGSVKAVPGLDVHLYRVHFQDYQEYWTDYLKVMKDFHPQQQHPRGILGDNCSEKNQSLTAHYAGVDPNFEIKGKTPEEIAAFLVRAQGVRTTTDSSGHFSLRLKRGSYVILAFDARITGDYPPFVENTNLWAEPLFVRGDEKVILSGNACF